MAETSPNSPDDQRGQADKETLSREARNETLFASYRGICSAKRYKTAVIFWQHTEQKRAGVNWDR
jgi:hypothetical protein